MRIFLAVALAVLLSNSVFARDLPDKTRTPGVANPDVTQDNIDQTICVSGWPEPYNRACGARIKDVLETRLKRLVCDRKLPLADAQKAIATDWVAAYKKYVNREGCPPLE